MKLYNKSGRALIIDVKYIIEGGRFDQTDTKKDRKYIDPNSDIEVTDEYGKQLLKMYPKELKGMDGSSSQKESVKKTVKRSAKKKSRKR